ncbi:MAG: hypothetical protein QM786_19370 [Breznakibacter sp.]
MDQDKALRKILRQANAQLPYGFENRVMQQIITGAEKKKRRAYVIGLMVTCVLAVLLAGGGYYVVSVFFPFDVQLSFPKIQMDPTSMGFLKSSICIGAMALFLLVIDTYFRKLLQKHKGE